MEFPLCVLFFFIGYNPCLHLSHWQPKFFPKKKQWCLSMAGETCLSKFCIIMLYRYFTFSLTDRTTQPNKILFQKHLILVFWWIKYPAGLFSLMFGFLCRRLWKKHKIFHYEHVFGPTFSNRPPIYTDLLTYFVLDVIM